MKKNEEMATFAGGCFWCTEAIFQRLKGVTSVMPGYTGGTIENPSYEAVCSGRELPQKLLHQKFLPTVLPVCN